MINKTKVQGDAARARLEEMKKMDEIVNVGSRVYDYCFRWGTVLRKNKVTYTVKFDSGGTYTRRKNYFNPLAKEEC